MTGQNNTRAIAAMMIAMASFILNDSLVKLASGDLPLGQIIFIRGFISIVLMLIACQVTGVLGKLHLLANRYVSFRAIAETLATLLYLSALFRMPIANATAILQVLPLAVTAGGALLLGNPVGWRRWTAIAVGFCGVLIIVRPGLAGFNVWSLVALAGVIFMAGRDLSTRKVPDDVPTFGVALVSIAGVTLLGGAMTVADGWVPMSLEATAYLAGAAVFILFGYVSIIVAMRIGEIAVIAPFRYSIVVWALVLGFLIWGDVPDVYTIAGIVIIVATGFYTFLREQKRAERTR